MVYAYALGRALAGARIKADVSVSRLAKHLDMPVHAVMDVETGFASLSSEQLTRWCDTFGLKAADVVARAAHLAPPGGRGLLVDLRWLAELARNGDDWTGGLGSWAADLLSGRDAPLMVVSDLDIGHLAAQLTVSKADLVEVLRDCVPLERDATSG